MFEPKLAHGQTRRGIVRIRAVSEDAIARDDQLDSGREVSSREYRIGRVGRRAQPRAGYDRVMAAGPLRRGRRSGFAVRVPGTQSIPVALSYIGLLNGNASEVESI